MRRLLGIACSVLAAALLTTACGAPNPAAPSPQSAAVTGTSSTHALNVVVPDLAACLRGGGPGCFTAGTGASTAIADLGQCFQSPGSPGCADGARLRGRAVAAQAAAPPSGLTYTANGGSVTLSWGTPGGDPVVSYIIEAGSAPGLANLASFSTGNTATSYSASGVGPGTYYVRVRGETSGGPSAPSNEVVVVVAGGGGPCTGAPGPPVVRIASNSGSTVVLSWVPGAGGNTSFILEAGSASGLSNLVNADEGNTTTLTATGVPDGTYYVRVRGRNGCGVGAPSSEIVVNVPGGTGAVEYRVTGSASNVLITYRTPTGESQTTAALPWSFSAVAFLPGDFLLVSAFDQQGSGGTIVVSIYKNGVLYKTSTATGARAIAIAQGTF
jgi:hypothetical protein